MTTFFKDLCSGKYGQQQVSFTTFVNKMKRNYLMDAIKSKDLRKKSEGLAILNNIKDLLKKRT
jgi:hypothetical protein